MKIKRTIATLLICSVIGGVFVPGILSNRVVTATVAPEYAAKPADDKVNQGVQDFVTRLYSVCLDRKPDSAGLKDWSNKLVNKEATGCSVAYGFIFSNEFINHNYSNEQYVTYMYKAFFGRNPDKAGFDSWVSILNNGATRESVFCGFANSVEFSNLCSSYGIVRGYHVEGYDCNSVAQVNLFVNRLYEVVLSRSCDNAGMEDWSRQLISHANTGSGVASGFVFSNEFKNKNTCNECYVDTLYKAFMDREADPAGMSDWVNRLNQGTSREFVFNGFVQSPEFIGICQSYGIENGSLSLDIPGTYGSSGTCAICGGVNKPAPNPGNDASTVVVTPTPSIWVDGSSLIKTGITKLPYNSKHEAYIKPTVDAKKYSYEIYPIIKGDNGFFYIKTDNPDPWSFAFVDKESVYYEDNYFPYYIRPITYNFPDIVYENKYTGRVHGGYIATAIHPKSRDMYMVGEVPMTIGYTDGGKLDLVVAKSYLFGEDYSYEQDGEMWHHPAQVNIYYDETDIVYDVGRLYDPVDYCINTYGIKDADLFTNLTAIQKGLNQIALYPRSLKDDTKNTGLYGSLATSPYVELGLNVHSDIYPSTSYSDFLSYVYPYTLNSYSFPNLMKNIAMRLEPNCEIGGGSAHQMFTVTYKGTTKQYGGQGAYVTQGSIYLSQIKPKFKFDGSSGDIGYNSSLKPIYDALIPTNQTASSNFTKLTTGLYYSEIKAVVGANGATGAWLRVGSEGSTYGSGKVYAYYTVDYGSIENVWVDGRYINRNNYYEDITFEESLKLKIMPSVFIDGKLYEYHADHKVWIEQSKYYYQFDTIDSEYILTKAQLKTMKLDRNHSKAPSHGYIYDGTVKPGTPF